MRHLLFTFALVFSTLAAAEPAIQPPLPIPQGFRRLNEAEAKSFVEAMKFSIVNGPMWFRCFKNNEPKEDGQGVYLQYSNVYLSADESTVRLDANVKSAVYWIRIFSLDATKRSVIHYTDERYDMSLSRSENFGTIPKENFITINGGWFLVYHRECTPAPKRTNGVKNSMESFRSPSVE